jgi:hypothetical protein
MLRVVTLGVAVVLLAGCSGWQAGAARRWAPGRALAELESCMGIPARVDARDGTTWAQWELTRPTSTQSLPFADLALLPVTLPISLVNAGSLSLASAGSCHAVATVRNGRVTDFHYAGDDDGLTGPDAVCAPLVRGCLREQAPGAAWRPGP